MTDALPRLTLHITHGPDGDMIASLITSADPPIPEEVADDLKLALRLLAARMNLRILREERGDTFASLAERCDPPMSKGYISDLEKGHRKPNPAVAARLAEALNVPRPWLELPCFAEEVQA